MAIDTRGEKVLKNVYPVLADKVRAASDELAAHATFLCVVSGLRTAAQQNALYAQGRTAPGKVVTNARAGYSMHNYGLAVDVVPYLSGDGGAVNWDTGTPQYRAMVAALEGQSLAWGGAWVSLKDYDHFQIGGLPASPNAAMLADYNGGANLKAIWAKVDSGAYNG